MKILFISLGCDKNLVDSEEMITRLLAAGHEMVAEAEEAEAIVVNTCCFIGDAKEESISTILEMASYKETGKLKALIVTGCLAQRYRSEILQEIPEVDACLGTSSWGEIEAVLQKVLEGEHGVESYAPHGPLNGISRDRVVSGIPGCTAYLKIAEGCDKHCTYCIIPSLRGPYRSVPMEELLEQAAHLAEGGVRELILVAQETTLYGTDLYGEKSLHVLLEKLCRIPGLTWIRVLYAYPEEIYEGLVEVMKRERKICHYLDMPIQHASDRILKKMGRRTTREDLVRIIGWLREEIPDIVLRTTLISGFPGETQEDFEEVYNFADEMEFDRLGVFPYSAEEGTPAYSMEGQVPEEVKLSRRDELMELAQEISLEKGEARVGQELLVMIEGKIPDESAYAARCYADAPQVDGLVFVESGEDLKTGDFLRVRITASLEYDLMGVACDEFTE